jgi:G:T/U-mismatch repair DNA glycosylase
MQERYGPQFESKALELVAKRVSAASGDMRTAMSICDTATCHAARLSRNKPTSASDSSVSVLDSKAETSGAITVSQIAVALAECCSGANAQTQMQVSAIRALPGQQQLLLCTLAIARGNAIATSPATRLPSQTFVSTSKPLPSVFHQRSILSTGAARTTPGKPRLATPQGTPRKMPFRAFGLATTPQATKSLNKAFPMADNDLLVTPSSAPSTMHGAATSPNVRKSDMSLQMVYTKYKAAAREAGFALVDMSQLQAMVSALQESGLLETRGFAKTSGRVAPRNGDKYRVSLAVSTTDVKHALSESRMLQPLVQQLP